MTYDCILPSLWEDVCNLRAERAVNCVTGGSRPPEDGQIGGIGGTTAQRASLIGDETSAATVPVSALFAWGHCFLLGQVLALVLRILALDVA